MSKMLLIIKREYLAIVGRKSFIIMTLLIPLLLVLLMLLPMWLSDLNANSASQKTTVMVIDETGKLNGAIPSDAVHEVIDLRGEPGKTDVKRLMKDSPDNLDALVVIPHDVLDSAQVTVYSKNTINTGLVNYINESLADTLTAVKLQETTIPHINEIVANSKVDLQVNSVKLGEDGSESDSSAAVVMVVGIVLAFVTYMFVLTYGSMIMNSVIEEKTNRIVEVIVSSCKPFELMMGKIVGVGLVGLTQFAIWIVILLAVLGFTGMFTDPDSPMEVAMPVIQTLKSINLVSILFSFVVYFIGGYLLFASLFAGFGSAVDQASDASQFMTPIILIMIIALYAGIGCMENPSGDMAVWCSIIPFTSPIVMMVRLPYEVPLWQQALSIVLLYATAVVMVWLSARIYRTGILLYGKKYSLKEILRWIKV